MVYEKGITGMKKIKLRIKSILWKIEHCASCPKNAVNFLVA